jgi:4-hydroxy-2-oxovalerate aldolase
MPAPQLQILECTLRDGSYAVDFQFTARDTALIVAALEEAGFTWIELGHGVGLNASRSGKGSAAASDEEYMQAAAASVRRARWGMFFIPGISRHEDLEMAARHGMGFVRIGTNATQVKESKAYIEHARQLGLHVSANLMKSYVLAPAQLAAQARLSESYGAQTVYLVDSAGCMLPEEIRDYVQALRAAVQCPIGFHGHNNLGLGLANTLAAVDSGAMFVDSTLQGIGRGGGNAPTEVLVTLLRRRGIHLGINVNHLMDIGAGLIKPLLQDKGWDSLNIMAGYAGFHSSYLGTILKHAQAHQVDPRDLMVAVCEIDQNVVQDEVVAEIAGRLAGPEKTTKVIRDFGNLTPISRPVDQPPSLSAAAARFANEAQSIAKKTGKHSVFNLVAAARVTDAGTVSSFVQEEFDLVIASAEIGNPELATDLIRAVDGVVNTLFVDGEQKPYLNQPLSQIARALAKKSRVLSYKDNDVWARCVDHQVGALLSEVFGRRITILGTGNLAMKLALTMAERGAMVTLSGDTTERLAQAVEAVNRLALAGPQVKDQRHCAEACRDAEALISFLQAPAQVSPELVEAVAADAVVVDAVIGSISAEAIACAIERGVRVVRPDMRAGLAAEVRLALGAHRLVHECMGRGELNGVPVVAGGLLGAYGEVVLDSWSNPSRALGVADGRGRVIYDVLPEFAEKRARVDNAIFHKLLAG